MTTPSIVGTTTANPVVKAFALGGLAGSNAHGAGCLQATIDKWGSTPPDAISCTSGQIYWVCIYLENLAHLRSPNPDPDFIRNAFIAEQDRLKPLFNTAHALYRYAFYDWPLPWLFWNFWKTPVVKSIFDIEPIEKYWKENAEKILRSITIPLNDLWFDHIEPCTLIFFPPLHVVMHKRDWALASRFWFGVPDKVKFQLHNIFIDVTCNILEAWQRVLFSTSDDDFVMKHFSPENLWPARTMRPALFTKDLLHKMFSLINSSPIAIIFNSYEPTQGHEIVYFNTAAGNLLSLPPTTSDNYRSHVKYQVLTSSSFKDALWLYYYGYKPGQRIDGAYFRQVMLSELQVAHEIYLARPVNRRWMAGVPKNEQDRRDMEFDFLLNGSYQAEEDRIELINRLLAQNNFAAGVTKFKPITIKQPPCEIRRPRGFWDYVFEDISVFDDARADFSQLI